MEERTKNRLIAGACLFSFLTFVWVTGTPTWGTESSGMGWNEVTVPWDGDYREDIPDGVEHREIACEPGVEIRPNNGLSSDVDTVVNWEMTDKTCRYYGPVEMPYFEIYGFRVRY